MCRLLGILKSFRLWILALLLTTLTIVFTSAPAFAHGALVSGNPGPGANVGTGVVVLELTFEGLKPGEKYKIDVDGPGNGTIKTGQPVPAGPATICLTVEPLYEQGVYGIAYDVTALDGHKETGRYLFQVTNSGNREPEPSQCADLDLPPPRAINAAVTSPLVIGLGAVIVIGLVALVLVFGNRRPRRQS